MPDPTTTTSALSSRRKAGASGATSVFIHREMVRSLLTLTGQSLIDD
jgi:hypothetical protein